VWNGGGPESIAPGWPTSASARVRVRAPRIRQPSTSTRSYSSARSAVGCGAQRTAVVSERAREVRIVGEPGKQLDAVLSDGIHLVVAMRLQPTDLVEYTNHVAELGIHACRVVEDRRFRIAVRSARVEKTPGTIAIERNLRVALLNDPERQQIVLLLP